LGGRLIDNPADYTDCPKCQNLVLVFWSKDKEIYFLGCSNYKNGCKWTKTIWTYESKDN